MCTHIDCQKCGTALKVTKSSLNLGAVEPCKRCSKKENPTHLEILQEAFERMGVESWTEETMAAIYLYTEMPGSHRFVFNKSSSFRNKLQSGG